MVMTVTERSLSRSRHIHRYGVFVSPQIAQPTSGSDDLPVIIRTDKKLHGEEVLRTTGRGPDGLC